MNDETLEAELQTRAVLYARAFSNTETVARKLAEWVRQVAPERMATAYWITVHGDQDEGISVKLYEKTLPRFRGRVLRLGGLLGSWSTGLHVSTPIFESDTSSFHVGVGAVVSFEDMGKVDPIVSFTIGLR